MTTTGDKSKQKQNGTKDPPNPSRTSSFAPDVTAKDTGRRLRTGDRQSKPPPGVQNCLCCSGLHELSSCPKLQNKALQSRLDIAKRHWLCHVCMRPGHHRGRCEPKGSVRVGVTNNTTDLLTTPQGETLLKPTEGIKPVKEDNLLERHQPQRMVSSRTLLKLGAQCSKQT